MNPSPNFSADCYKLSIVELETALCDVAAYKNWRAFDPLIEGVTGFKAVFDACLNVDNVKVWEATIN